MSVEMTESDQSEWKPGVCPIAVIMISLNEGHNMEAVCENLSGWAQEVFLVDSYSKDETVDIALKYGVQVVQRRFRGFGDQWNFALRNLPINAEWTMKLDPDERLSDELKESIRGLMESPTAQGVAVKRELWFMGRPLPIKDEILRVWRTGSCSFTEVSVNEHPVVAGEIVVAEGALEHQDSPDMEHWVEKQNRYTSSEALGLFSGASFADIPKYFGTPLQRRMWFKKNFYRLPFRYLALFVYYFFIKGTWRVGRVGLIWARLRCDVMRMVEYKHFEMKITGKTPAKRTYGPGASDMRVPQAD
jgi:glycosyltransferase involved in cell wall biosynthesis